MGGNIKGITIEFNGDTSKLDSALRKINQNVRGIDKELRQVDKALKFNPTSVELWRQKQDLLKKKITETKTKLDALKQAQAKMDAEGVDKNSEEYRKLQREIIETESKLKTFKSQLRSIGNANLKALGEQMKKVGDQATKIGKSLSMYVTAPLTAVGASAAKSFAEVDKTMQLTNATMGNTKDQADLLNQAMKSAAAESIFGMNDAATATLNFARAGLSAEEAAAALAPAMNLAAAAGGDLDTVSGGLVATINGFGGSFDEASTYADVFANACNNSALDINSLSESMSVAAPIFKAAGYSVQDAALYMGVMANAGIDASTAANALKTGMARLVSPSKEAQGWLDKLDFSITNADGSMKDSVQVQKELNTAFGTLSESEQIAAASAIFGKNQMSNWLALINTAPSAVSELNGQLAENGTVNEQAAAMMSGFGGSLESLKSNIDVAKVSLGEALAPIILKVANAIQTLVEMFNSMSPVAQRIVAVVGVIAAAIGPLLVIFGTLASSIGALLPAFGVLGGAIAGISAPILPIVGIIAAVIAAFIIWRKHGDKIKKFFSDFGKKIVEAWDGIKEGVSEAVDSIKESVSNTFNSIKTVINTALQNAKKVVLTVFNAIKTVIRTAVIAYVTIIRTQFTIIKTVVTTILNGIKLVVTTVFNAIKTFITTAINGWKTIITTGFNAIKTIASTTWNAVKTAIITPLNAARNAVSTAVNAIKARVSGAFSGIAGGVRSAFNAVKNAITQPLNTAKTLVQKAVSAIKRIFPIRLGKIFSGVKLPHFRISGGSAPWGIGGKGTKPSVSIDWYKKGGIFNSPSVIGVGEAGSEAVVPLDKFWNKLDRLAENATSGGDIIININGANSDPTAIAEEVKRVLIQETNRRRLAWQ